MSIAWSKVSGPGTVTFAQSNQAQTSATFSSAGTYELKLTASDSQLSANDNVLVNVTSTNNTPPVANFSSNTNYLSVTFTNSSTDSDGSIASSAWEFGDGASSSASNPTHQYAAAGTYPVKLTVTDNSGATNAITQSITVSAPPSGNVPEQESNDTTGTAQLLQTSGITIDGTMSSSSDVDYYKVMLPAGKTIQITMTPNSSSDYDLFLYNSNLSLIGKSENGSGKVDSISVKNTGSSTYARYIKVTYYGGATGSNGKYTLKVTW